MHGGIIYLKSIRIILLIFLAIARSAACLGQDLIYKKDYSYQLGRVLEVTTDKVKFLKAELPRGPTFEISRTEIWKIKYANGYTDFFDTLVQEKFESIDWVNQADTNSYSIIYILFNYGSDEEQVVPIHFNGKYVYTLRNHRRLTYKMFSSGVLQICRKVKGTAGPCMRLHIQPGKRYGIRIEEPHPQALDPARRFLFTTFEIKADSDPFLNFEFYGFEPFENCDIHMQEDVNNPIPK